MSLVSQVARANVHENLPRCILVVVVVHAIQYALSSSALRPIRFRRLVDHPGVPQRFLHSFLRAR